MILVLLIGLRREVGADWWNYLTIFRNIGRGGFGDALHASTEPAYGLLNWIAAKAGWGIWFPNLVCGALFTWGLLAFSRQQPNPLLAIAVAIPYFVIGVGMGYTRQSAALGLVLLAMIECVRGRQARMYLFLILAPTFHTSAIIAIPLLALVAVRGGLVTTALVMVVGAIMILQFSGRIQAKLDFYGSRSISSSGAILRLAMNLIPSLIYLSFRQRFTRNPAELRLWTIIAWTAVGSMLLLFFFESTIIVDRMGLYLIPIQIFVFSRLPSVLGARGRPSLLLIFVILAYSLAVQVAWLSLGSWGHAWLPYRNYLWSNALEKNAPRWFRMR